MKIQTTTKLERSAVPVMVRKNGTGIRKHQFFRLLKKEDRTYLERSERQKLFIDEGVKLLLLPSGVRTLVIGAPNGAKFTRRKSLLLMRRAIANARVEKLKHIEVALDDFRGKSFDESAKVAEALGTQYELANFEFTKYKTRPKDGWGFVEHASVFVDKNPAAIARGLRTGKIIGEEVNAARILSNIPGGDMTPAKLAHEAARTARKCGFRAKILAEKEIRKLRMGGVLGVSKGSVEKPHFIILEYLKGPKKEPPIVLVGKGVTFDTGGLNLKPSDYIYEMHMDMSGGAAVIHTIAALARLKVRKNVVGLIPAVENMPSGSSYHPGDLLTTMSGKTIEVLNTDAEGRVILSDALTYAKRYNPRLVVDIATLTGAAEAALGQRASALFTTDEKLEKAIREAGEETGDFVWPLPLWEEYEEEIRGTFGDVANIGKTKYGGAITGAVFLWQFVKDEKTGPAPAWVHLDIAPRMTTIEGEYLAKGAAGASINLLTNFLQKF